MDESPDLKRRSFLLGRFAEPHRSAELHVAVIEQSCLTFRGIACMSCRDSCQADAVRFTLALGGARPSIITEACTGCGDCAQACPADAIQISMLEEAS